jgi:hypothetical protein
MYSTYNFISAAFKKSVTYKAQKIDGRLDEDE